MVSQQYWDMRRAPAAPAYLEIDEKYLKALGVVAIDKESLFEIFPQLEIEQEEVPPAVGVEPGRENVGAPIAADVPVVTDAFRALEHLHGASTPKRARRCRPHLCARDIVMGS